MSTVVEVTPEAVEPEPVQGFQEPVGRSVNSALSSKTGRRIVYVLVFLWTIPTFGVFVSSFRDEIAVKTTGWWTFLWNPHFTLQNYKSVLGSSGGGDNLTHFFLNSLRITIPATVISVGIALLAAYAFSWMQFKGRDWLYVAVIAMLGRTAADVARHLEPALQRWRTHRHVHHLPRPQPQQLGGADLDRPHLFRHAVLHLHLEELRIVATARGHRGRPCRRRRPPDDLLQAGAAAVGAGRGVAVHLPVRLHLERPADRAHLRRLRQPADHRQDGRGVGLPWPIVAPARPRPRS